MHIIHALYIANGGFYPRQFHSSRRALKQNVQRLAHDAEARPQNHGSNAKRKRRVNPNLSGGQNGPAPNNDRRGRKRVPDFMKQSAAQVDVAIGSIQHQGDAAIHNYPRARHPNHGSSMYRLGLLDASDRLVED